MPSKNNFGFLRLLFALLVIVSHSPQLVDGNAAREPWRLLFGGGFTFGGFAVYGFFLISGYLITKSFENSATVSGYLTKRALRIYPGYLAAFLVSLVLFGYLAGGDLATLTPSDWIKQIVYMAFLNQPYVQHAFSGLHNTGLNGSMWTIPYEFTCYIAVIAFGFSGLLRRKALYLAITATIIIVALPHTLDAQLHSHLARPFPSVIPYYFLPPMGLNQWLVFFAVFLSGGAFYLFRDHIRYTNHGAFFATTILIPAIYSPMLIEPALATAGAYLLFWFAFTKAPFLRSIGGETDLSYGVYLYAWPVQNLLIFRFHGIQPTTVTVIAICISLVFAYISWTIVEGPAMALAKSRHSRQPSAGDVSAQS